MRTSLCLCEMSPLTHSMAPLPYITSPPPLSPPPSHTQVLADVKKVITDEDLLGLVSDNMDTADAAGWEVIDLHVSHGSLEG